MGVLVSPPAQLAASLGQRRLRLLGVFCLHHHVMGDHQIWVSFAYWKGRWLDIPFRVSWGLEMKYPEHFLGFWEAVEE